MDPGGTDLRDRVHDLWENTGWLMSAKFALGGELGWLTCFLVAPRFRAYESMNRQSKRPH